jgi:hypothetical protein
MTECHKAHFNLLPKFHFSIWHNHNFAYLARVSRLLSIRQKYFVSLRQCHMFYEPVYLPNSECIKAYLLLMLVFAVNISACKTRQGPMRRRHMLSKKRQGMCVTRVARRFICTYICTRTKIPTFDICRYMEGFESSAMQFHLTSIALCIHMCVCMCLPCKRRISSQIKEKNLKNLIFSNAHNEGHIKF